MTRQRSLALALLLAGCMGHQASTVRVPDARVARLPARDQQEIASAEKRADVAEQKLMTARQAREEAIEMRRLADRERDTARLRINAAAYGVEVGRLGSEPPPAATRELALVANAKRDYADRLVALRQAEVEEADDAVSLERADVNMTKARLLERNNLAQGIDVTRIAEEQRHQQRRLATDRRRVAQLRGEVAQLQANWEQRQRACDTASNAAVP